MDFNFDKYLNDKLTAEEFVNLSDKERANIAHSEIIPPKFGDNNSTYFKVEYRVPQFKLRKA